MSARSRPPTVEFATRGANPTLETIEYIRAALRRADGPISRNSILRILAEWGHSTTRQSLNSVLEFMGSDGNVAEGSKGLIWVPEASPSLIEAILAARRL